MSGRIFLTFLLSVLTTVTGATDEQTDKAFELLANVPYVTRADQPLQMNLYVPEADGPFPAVLLVHGGAWRMGNRWHMHSVAQTLASRGYVVAAVSYRFAPAHRFPAQLEDCADAVRFLRKNASKYKCDPARIGGFGYSAGGHLVSLLGTCTDGKTFPFLDSTSAESSTRLQAHSSSKGPA